MGRLRSGQAAAVVFALLLVASDLATIVAIEGFATSPLWLWGVRVALLAAAGLALWFGAGARLLAGLAAILTVLVLARGAVVRWGIGPLPERLPEIDGGMLDGIAFGVMQKALVALPVLIVLLWVCRGPRGALLGAGDLSAPVGRMAVLRLGGTGLRWRLLGPLAALAIAAGTFLAVWLTVFGGQTTAETTRLVPLLPAVVLLAATNAFLEGLIYRNAVLGPLRKLVPVGWRAVMAGAFFGIAHFYGAPSGVAGVLLASVFGWFLCRCMIETRGFLLPWFIHFVQDVVIFSLAAVMVTQAAL